MSHPPLKTLLIEDSVTQARFVTRLLEQCGCEVFLATSARELMQKIKALEAFDPQVAFVDIHLQDTHGADLLWPLKQKWDRLVAVVMTADSKDEYSILADAREKGADLVLRKPFTLPEARALFRDVHSLMTTGQRLCHVAVIDDSLVVCKSVAEMLASKGCRVSAFTKGEEAVQRLCYDQVDAAIVDLNMPGMGGRELINLVRDVWPGVAVVAMSGSDADGETGAEIFLPKPFDTDTVMNAVEEARNAHNLFDENDDDMVFL